MQQIQQYNNRKGIRIRSAIEQDSYPQKSTRQRKNVDANTNTNIIIINNFIVIKAQSTTSSPPSNDNDDDEIMSYDNENKKEKMTEK